MEHLILISTHEVRDLLGHPVVTVLKFDHFLSPDSEATTTPVPDKVRLKCRSMNNTCAKDAVLFKAHGPLTGYCIESDR